MSYCLSCKYARRGDSDFIVAAARAIYCDWYLSDEKREARISGPGVELTEVVPETQRWAFRMAREFFWELCRTFGPGWMQRWFDKWDGDREPTEENAGWYAAMQAMGHGIGLSDAGGLDIKLPRLEASPSYSERELKNRGWAPDACARCSWNLRAGDA